MEIILPPTQVIITYHPCHIIILLFYCFYCRCYSQPLSSRELVSEAVRQRDVKVTYPKWCRMQISLSESTLTTGMPLGDMISFRRKTGTQASCSPSPKNWPKLIFIQTFRRSWPNHPKQTKCKDYINCNLDFFAYLFLTVEFHEYLCGHRRPPGHSIWIHLKDKEKGRED